MTGARREHRETVAGFTVDITPADPLLPGTGRFDITKAWDGGVVGTGHGVMLSAGDPTAGAAGYVALEIVEGTLDGRAGTFALHQLGTMGDGEQELRYEVVPGSGTGELAGLVGSVALTVVDGRHEVRLAYTLP